jgi:hypothetical protein
MKHSSTEDRWRRLLAEHERSGLGVRQFAEERGLSAWSLYAWRQRLGLSSRRGRRGGRQVRKGGSGKLVPVQVIDEPPGLGVAGGNYPGTGGARLLEDPVRNPG